MNGNPFCVDKHMLAVDLSIAVRRSLRGSAKDAQTRILSILNDEIVDFAESVDDRVAAIMKLIEQEKGE